jgi:hypothetical protein
MGGNCSGTIAFSAAVQGFLPGQTQRRVAGNQPSPARPPIQRRRRGIIVEPASEMNQAPSGAAYSHDFAPDGAWNFLIPICYKYVSPDGLGKFVLIREIRVNLCVSASLR